MPVGVGITPYGVAYALVHDGWIHRRVGWFDGHHVAVLDRLAAAHRIHHQHNGAPFGMLIAGRAARASRSAGGLPDPSC